MERRCESCEELYETKSPRSRFCSSTCRSRAHRGGLTVVDGVVAMPTRATAGEMATSVQQHLESVGRLDTVFGQAAVDMARRIDESPRATLSQAATAHRELRAAIADAVKGANATKSVLQQKRDELAARRQQRQA